MAFGRFPKDFPNVFPKKQGSGRGLWMLTQTEHFHRTTLRPRLRSGNKKKMARDLMQGKSFYDRMKNQARQQLALMNRCRMHRQGGKAVANQSFYVQFLNR
jgi:hypothetical protein